MSGVQRYGFELLRALDRAAAAGSLSDLAFEVVVPARPTITMPPLDAIRVRAVGRLRGHAWEQLELTRAARETVLFCPANTAPLSALLGRTRTVVTIHSLSFLEARASYRLGFQLFYRALIPQALRRAAAVITVSRTERDRILERYPRAGPRLLAVDNGAVPESFGALLQEPAPPAPPRPFVLFVGTPMPSKNLALLVAALERIDPGNDFDLVVAGATAGAYRTSAVTASAAHGRLRFAGQVTDDRRLVELYRTATCLVQPSSYESSCLPPLEAMACGCPVVCSDLPTLRERCQDAARYFVSGDELALAAALGAVLRDASLRTELRARGLEQARGCSWDRCALETAAILRSVGTGADPDPAMD